MNKLDGKSLRQLKNCVWAYFLLLIFEGALRKWILPGLATPLLVIRDPLAVWILFKVWEGGLLPKSVYLNSMFILGFLGMITAVLFGHGNLAVAIYGARMLMVNFPLMFAIGKILDRNDVLKIGRVLLIIAIPMAMLITAQFYSPQSAWVNKGVGGDSEGAGFSGALGFFRPPGTFSFTSGNSLFFSFTGAFVVYFWLNPSINKIILILSSAAVIVAIPLSISRSLFFSVGISVAFAFIATLLNGKNAGKIIGAGFVIIIGLMLLSQISFFQTATEAFTSRFTSANETEGGLKGTIGDRYFGGMIAAVSNSLSLPFFGYGIGMGTNVGSMLLTGGAKFLISEEEWGRIIGEMGALMGVCVIFVRIGLSLKLLFNAFKKMMGGDLLPWMLLSFGLLVLPQGQWAQPTSLGFTTVIGGLIIATMTSTINEKKLNNNTGQIQTI
jgi:hypothetical protein